MCSVTLRHLPHIPAIRLTFQCQGLSDRLAYRAITGYFIIPSARRIHDPIITYRRHNLLLSALGFAPRSKLELTPRSP